MLPYFFNAFGDRVGGFGIGFVASQMFYQFLARHFLGQGIQYRRAPAVISDFHAHAAMHHAR